MEPVTFAPVDLTALDVIAAANRGAPIKIVHPTNSKPVGLYIQVVGKDSDEFRAVSMQQNRARLIKMTKDGKFKPDAVAQEEIDNDGIAALAKATKGFFYDEDCTHPAEILVDKDKPALGFSYKNCVTVYERMPWIKEQVDSGIADRSVFLQG